MRIVRTVPLNARCECRICGNPIEKRPGECLAGATTFTLRAYRALCAVWKAHSGEDPPIGEGCWLMKWFVLGSITGENLRALQQDGRLKNCGFKTEAELLRLNDVSRRL